MWCGNKSSSGRQLPRDEIKMSFKVKKEESEKKKAKKSQK